MRHKVMDFGHITFFEWYYRLSMTDLWMDLSLMSGAESGQPIRGRSLQLTGHWFC